MEKRPRRKTAALAAGALRVAIARAGRSAACHEGKPQFPGRRLRNSDLRLGRGKRIYLMFTGTCAIAVIFTMSDVSEDLTRARFKEECP
jgi:hypothetical protein